MHSIIAKTNASDTATTNYETEVFQLAPPVLETLKERLIEAAGRNSKAFELELSYTEPTSFYGLCSQLSSANDEGFISKSQEIAELLASTQLRASIPGGYLIVIDAKDSVTKKSIYIVIKAELHEALKYSLAENGKAQIELLDQVFLSPSQKLFKIGILYQNEIDQSLAPSKQYGCFLFDDQFRDGSPAEYFYKDFLGFTIDKNEKIQSKKFYDKTEAFIKSLFSDSDTKSQMLNFLKTTFTVNTDPIVTPYQFGQSMFLEGDILDKYDSEVVSDLPSSFVKDATLLNTRLAKKKIDFPDNINIIGPDTNFDQHVTLISSSDQLSQIDPTDSSYTIVKILGKPFSNE